MKSFKILAFTMIVLLVAAFTVKEQKLVSKNVHISFFSYTPVEDITAHNYKVVSTLDKATGEVVFSVPMQSFEFEKALMQKHYNSDKFLDTKEFPKAKLTGKITNLGDIDFKKDGTYQANVKGELTIKGKTNPISEPGTITIKNGSVSVATKFNIVLADYGITFAKGKPATNIAKEIEISVEGDYSELDS
jgi:polyisoprenoid-binding protein YceI